MASFQSISFALIFILGWFGQSDCRRFNPNRQLKNHTNLGNRDIDNSDLDAVDNDKLMVIMDNDCMNNLTAEERSGLILELFPCVSKKSHHGLMKSMEGRASILFLEIIDDSCMDDNDTTTDLDDFCIETIMNEPMTKPLFGSCMTQDVSRANLPSQYAWALDHFDDKHDNIYSYFDVETPDIDLFIIDSGIADTHEEFQDNNIIHVLGDGPDSHTLSNGQTWFASHGTHVASIAGGKSYGMTKGLNIYDFRVCEYSTDPQTDYDYPCSFSDIISSLVETASILSSTGRRGVVNLSLGGLGNRRLEFIYDEYFQDIVDSGGIIAVAAGNEGQNACDYVPAFSTLAITVGAYDVDDIQSSWSNFGSCVDVYGPGVDVTAAVASNNNNNYETWSGTSMASPAIAGLVANILMQCEAESVGGTCSMDTNQVKYPKKKIILQMRDTLIMVVCEIFE